MDLGAPSPIGGMPPPMAGKPPMPPDDDEGAEANGERPYPDPAAVGFRAEGETCDACEYNSSGNCTMLNIPIGTSCNLYEAKKGDAGAGDDSGAAGDEMTG
jgi:hypothetical protein